MPHKTQILLSLLLSGLTVTAVAADYRYDGLGRLVQAIHPSGQTLNYRYDPAGNLLEITGTATALHLLQGEVRDAAGNPLPGANILADDYTAVSDAAGHWQIPALPAGDYSLSAAHPGHSFSPQSLSLSADTAVTLTAAD